MDSQVTRTNRKTTGPDLAILIAASARALADVLLAAMAENGLGEMRPSYGFVIRAVAAEQPTINRLAELLDVTKQAASQLADEMQRAGFLDRTPDPGDRRSVRLGLTARGRKVLATALSASRKLENELRRATSAGDVAAFRRVLLAFVEGHGSLDEVQARRARPVW